MQNYGKMRTDPELSWLDGGQGIARHFASTEEASITK